MLVGSAILAIFSACVVAAANCPVESVSGIIAHSGKPTGKELTHDGATLYVTKPEGVTNTTTAVLYLTDVMGIQLVENKLLADSFARAGYLTVAPDMFNGTPLTGDINAPGFNLTAFLDKHGPAATDPIVAKAVAYLRTLGVKRIAATGYCFGGRYAFRAAGGRGADVAFAAHPSLLEDSEISAVKNPISVAAAEDDSLMPPEQRAKVEALLQKTGLAYSLALYGGTSHGFGVRVNISDPRQKFGKETAFLQAVRWFDSWL